MKPLYVIVHSFHFVCLVLTLTWCLEVSKFRFNLESCGVKHIGCKIEIKEFVEIRKNFRQIN